MSQNFIEIPTSMLRASVILNFNIFLRGIDGGYVLFAAKDMPLDKKALLGLENVYIKSVYVDEDDEIYYRDFLRNNLIRFANDRSLDRDEKSKLIYDSARSVMRGLFEKEDLPEAIADVKVAAEVIMGNIISDEKAFLSLVQASSYDYYTYTHCINVAIYSIGIGRFLGFSQDDLKALALGAALHDVGKSKVDQNILNKQEKLNDEEFNHIKQHAPLGFEILFETVGEMDERVLSAVRHHHEKLDGSGYPDGISGSKISTFARIVAVADIFDALNTKRCYKNSMSTFETLSFMKSNMAPHLDANVLKSFIMCMSGK